MGTSIGISLYDISFESKKKRQLMLLVWTDRGGKLEASCFRSRLTSKRSYLQYQLEVNRVSCVIRPAPSTFSLTVHSNLQKYKKKKKKKKKKVKNILLIDLFNVYFIIIQNFRIRTFYVRMEIVYNFL